MATSDVLLNKMNESIAVLQSAQQTVVQGAERLGNAMHRTGDESITGKKTFFTSPEVPTPTPDDSSLKAANMAALAVVKKTADAALLKSGGKLDGPLLLDGQAASTQLTIRNRSAEIGKAGDDTFRRFQFTDKNDDELGAMSVARVANGSSYTALHVDTKKDDGTLVSAAARLHAMKSGSSYLEVPTPFAADISDSAAITRLYAKQMLVRRLTGTWTIHVFGPNASDTAGLYAGRGETADMPFASIDGALIWAATHYAGPNTVNLVLHANYTFTDPARFNCLPLFKVVITSDSTQRTIKFNQGMYLYSGLLVFANINLELGRGLHAYPTEQWSCLEIGADVPINCLSGCDCAFAADLPLSKVWITSQANGEISGSVSTATAVAMNGGTILTNRTMQGNVTGKRYQATRGSLIIAAAHNFPGTEEGTADASSTVTLA